MSRLPSIQQQMSGFGRSVRHSLGNVAHKVASTRLGHVLFPEEPTKLDLLLPNGFFERHGAYRIRQLACIISLLVPLGLSAVLLHEHDLVMWMAKSVDTPKTFLWWMPFFLSFFSLYFDNSRLRLTSALHTVRAENMLSLLFREFPPGYFFVSYCWGDGVDLPRKVAGLMPSAWLDVHNLVPGRKIVDACQAAVTASTFRFVFVSPAYLKSRNCLVEWELIDREPGQAFIFAYPNMDRGFLEDLRRQGHHVFELEAEPRLASGDTDLLARFLIDSMASTGVMRPMFSHRSPRINESMWPLMLGHLYREVNVPELLGYGVLCGFWIWLGAETWTHCKGDFQLIFGGVCAFNLFSVVVAMLYYCSLSFPPVPDVACLQLILCRLALLPPIRMHSNDPGLYEDSQIQFMIYRGAFVPVESPEDADIKIVELKHNEEFLGDLTEHTLLWSRAGFAGLSDSVKQRVQSRIIADVQPTLELISCHAVAAGLGCGMEGLCAGSGHFEFRFAEHQRVVSQVDSYYDQISGNVERALHWRSHWRRGMRLHTRFHLRRAGALVPPPTPTERTPLVAEESDKNV